MGGITFGVIYVSVAQDNSSSPSEAQASQKFTCPWVKCPWCTDFSLVSSLSWNSGCGLRACSLQRATWLCSSILPTAHLALGNGRASMQPVSSWNRESIAQRAEIAGANKGISANLNEHRSVTPAHKDKAETLSLLQAVLQPLEDRSFPMAPLKRSLLKKYLPENSSRPRNFTNPWQKSEGKKNNSEVKGILAGRNE